MTLACGAAGDPGPAPTTPAAWPSTGTGTAEVGGRQVTVHVPDSYDPARPAPLVVLLHGYSSDAAEQESYLRFTPESDRRGFVYAYPDGTVDDRGNRFWNATDACCAFSGARPDDSAYLSDLITALRDTYKIDRVYLIGHSNGGFMAFRMACDHAGQVTAIASLNGATWNDDTQCRPSEPVGVLAIHSTDDDTIAFAGGTNGGHTYPSAAGTIARWRDHNRCTGAGSDEPALDVVADVPAAETSVRTYACADGSAVRSWTVNGGSHIPGVGPGFAPAVIDFLLAQT
ncbi:hydrolase [Actinoplanes italicus]|uniref:alpha/beta hydrolase family esterase n=1 Tax=Actinoplanes italicus TaxID=113567 RepID=UPI00147421DA|nr:alpha/beta fold hydrolase [Actinoplanes italicus]GIE28057.1 hydrolase [Actinoplanes italicus]